MPREVGVVEQLEQRRAHLAEVVRRDAGGHADAMPVAPLTSRFAGARQHDGSVFVRRSSAGTQRYPVDLLEHLVGDARQAALGIPHGRGRVPSSEPKLPDPSTSA